MAAEYTDADLAGLSAAEREALLDDDQDGQTPTETQIDPVIPEDADPADPDADPVDPDPAADPADAPAADAPADADADPAPADPVEEPAPEKPAPVFKAEPVVDLAAKLAVIEDQKAALLTQVDEGEISLGDAVSAIDKLSEEAFNLRLADNNARLAADMEKQAQQNAWDKECNSFLDKNKEYRASTLRFNALNQMVIALAEKPENFKLTEAKLLAKAHEAVEKELGPAPGKAKAPVASNQQKKTGESLPELPTLNKLASSELNSTGQDKFAALDRLSGVALEDAIKALSPRERAEYERGN